MRIKRKNKIKFWLIVGISVAVWGLLFFMLPFTIEPWQGVTISLLVAVIEFCITYDADDKLQALYQHPRIERLHIHHYLDNMPRFFDAVSFTALVVICLGIAWIFEPHGAWSEAAVRGMLVGLGCLVVFFVGALNQYTYCKKLIREEQKHKELIAEGVLKK